MTSARALWAAVALMGLAGCAVAKPPAMETSPPAAPRRAEEPRPATPEAPRLAEQVSRLAGELNELQNAVARLLAASQQQEGQIAALQRRVAELASHPRDSSVPSGFAALPPPPPPPSAPVRSTQAEELYDVAMAKYRQNDPDSAVLTLYELVATYPTDPLRERAQLMVADILYAQRDFAGARAELEALLGAVPRGSLTPDALLKLGLCYRALRDEPAARRSWDQLLREYPASPAAGQARLLLRAPRPG